MKIDFKTDETQAGCRVDQVIAERFAGISRSRAAALIKGGDILVSGRRVKPGYRLRPGDTVTGEGGRTVSAGAAPEQIPIDILWEDRHILVVNKQAGMVVHPGAGNPGGTLLNALLHHFPALETVGDDPNRAGIVHRLDKDTTGVMVAAKSNAALAFLQKEFRMRRVEKRYLALVRGEVKNDSGRISFPVGRHRRKRKLMSTRASESARDAETLWTVKERFADATLVEAVLKTGRTHQVRVHFYAAGHPLIGEKVYQFRRDRKNKTGVPRQMLHARSLGFRHPFSGRKVRFTAPVPPDFRKLLADMGSTVVTRGRPSAT